MNHNGGTPMLYRHRYELGLLLLGLAVLFSYQPFYLIP